MAVPAGFAMRVANRAFGLPYEVKLHLPPIKGQSSVVEPRCVGADLDIVPPSGDERHIALGRFLDTWSRLEGMTAFFIAALLTRENLADARLVLSTLGMRQILDLLEALAESRLSGDPKKTLLSFVERIGKLNAKRNTLVHGHWVLEGIVLKKNNEAVLRSQFVRESAFMDAKTLELISDHKNQKERVRHVFTLKRIDGATRDLEVLSATLGEFLQVLKRVA